MSRSLRSTKGCWTCRLRRKKCDEKHPTCELCRSLGIPCYGYGPKPEWMNGGDIEKTQIENLKQTVKYTSRQRELRDRTNQTNQSSATDLSSSSIISSQNISDDIYTDLNQEEWLPSITSYSANVLSPIKDTSKVRNGVRTQKTPQNTTEELSSSDTRLLMHFLDKIYAFELPFSESRLPTIRSDRDWLLPLIMHMKPLYHAVLSLSAFHQQASLSRSTAESYQLRTQRYIQNHHSLCLQNLQVEIKLLEPYTVKPTACPRRGVGILTSILQLVLLEMCIDETGTWQVHLNAATSMVEGITGVRKRLPEPEKLTQIEARTASILGWYVPDDSFSPEHPLFQQYVALDSLLAITIKMDVLSCITAGKPPRLQKTLKDFAETPSSTNPNSMLGNEFWIILLIGNIAMLQDLEPMSTSSNSNVPNGCVQPCQEHIKSTLYRWIQSNFQFIEQLQCPEGCTLSAATSTRLATYLFSLAAIIYLQLATTGVYADSKEIRTCVSSFVKVFGLTKHISTPQSLMWPVYITASVAMTNEHAYFRTILRDSLSQFSIGPCLRVLEKLESIWEMKAANGVINPIFCSDLQCSDLLLL